MVEFEKWIYSLKSPAGLEAQLKMAPQLRKEELEEYKNMTPQYQSAVLVLLYHDKEELKLLLTLRSKNLKKHGGQISFPGGKCDKTDRDIIHTAYREAWEEVGIESDNLKLLGNLSPLLIPVTGFNVFPVVAYCNKRPIINTSAFEVERIIEASISELCNPLNISQNNFGDTTSGNPHYAPYFLIQDMKIWGATAMMISELLLTLFPDSEFSKSSSGFLGQTI